MRITLRAGEKIYLNGAVVAVDRKVSLELLNDATFLLGSHVLQAGDASSPLRQIYFAAQLMLMDPADAQSIRPATEKMFASFIETMTGHPLAEDVAAARALFRSGRLIDVLKTLRRLFAAEALLANPLSQVDDPMQEKTYASHER